MFIDGALSDIASPWIGNFESTESLEEGRKEEDSYSDFFDFLTVEGNDIHCSSIHRECSVR